MRWTLAVVLILSALALSVVGKGTWSEPCHQQRVQCNIHFIVLYFGFISEPSITCGDYVMVVSFEKNRFPSLDANRLHLLYPSCQATETSTHLLVNTSLNGCGTSFVETEDAITFSNVVQQDAAPLQRSANDGSALITREHDFQLPFECSYSRKKLLSLHFVPMGRIDILGVGMNSFILDVPLQ